jgi:SAM-dependent methyltransferase
VKPTKRVLQKLVAELTWMGCAVGRRLERRAHGLRRLLVRPHLPGNPDGRILVHLGCGDVNSPEFINVDARPRPHVHYVRDVCDLSVFADDYADLVYACHVLEHIQRRRLKTTLQEWRRVLKPGGILRLSVPDFDLLLGIYDASGRDIESIIDPLVGAQNYAGNFHYSVFNLGYLSRLLVDGGFHNIRTWDPHQVTHHGFSDWASKTVERAGRSYRVSLNVEAVK